MSQLVVIEKDELSTLISMAVQDGYRKALINIDSNCLSKPTDYPPNMRDELAAKYIGVKASTLRNWRSNGIGPRFTRHGRAITYARADLDTYLLNKRVKTYD